MQPELHAPSPPTVAHKLLWMLCWVDSMDGYWVCWMIIDRTLWVGYWVLWMGGLWMVLSIFYCMWRVPMQFKRCLSYIHGLLSQSACPRQSFLCCIETEIKQLPTALQEQSGTILCYNIFWAAFSLAKSASMLTMRLSRYFCIVLSIYTMMGNCLGTIKRLSSEVAPHLDEASEDPTTLTIFNKDTGEKIYSRLQKWTRNLCQWWWAYSNVATTLEN